MLVRCAAMQEVFVVIERAAGRDLSCEASLSIYGVMNRVLVRCAAVQEVSVAIERAAGRDLSGGRV